MTADRIGEAAGQVWSLLEETVDARTLSQIKRQVDGFSADEVSAAVGWLAREGKLSFETQGRKTLLSLSQESAMV